MLVLFYCSYTSHCNGLDIKIIGRYYLIYKKKKRHYLTMNAFKLVLLFYLTFTLNEFSEKNSCFPFNLGANCSLSLNVKGLSTPGKFNHQNKLRLLARCHSGCLFEVSTAFVGGTFLIFGWGFGGIGYIDVG